MGSPVPSPLRAAVARVLRDLGEAEGRAGRRPGSVKLVAVTKTVLPGPIREAWELGLRCFGENYVQEALTKAAELPSQIEWHFIGRLQTNKAKQAVETFSLVQSVDRPSLAEALEKAARTRGVRLPVLLQVNVGAEESKAGATPEGAVELLRRAPEWPDLEFRGLMAIPPYSPDPEHTRPHFRALRELRDRMAALGVPGVELRELSMGMSGDFAVAIEEGATMVRIGTALFGERGGA